MGIPLHSNAWHKRNRNAFFQLTDNFTLFHFSFMSGGVRDPNFWMNSVGGPRLANWEGQSFESFVDRPCKTPAFKSGHHVKPSYRGVNPSV